MDYYLVCADRAELPRLGLILPELKQRNCSAVMSEAQPGDQVWIMAQLPNCLDEVRALSRQQFKVVVLTLSVAVEEALMFLEAGASGYVNALAPVPLLQRVALVIESGGLWLPEALLSRVVHGAYQALTQHDEQEQDIWQCLTAREQAVAQAVVEGKSNKLIARELGITERTVKAHLGSAFRKLEVSDRLQLVLKLTGKMHATP
ncbi:hypothetical protein BFW38_17280 [Terasakiispira papahanaumokuakeensis]|uniref:HTH luxR-type domain-containing protein n=1 Tax=Terasakiispira papahanaumokuakeensis TaxID=197479 RepID=A0A1E2VEC9_9GAMM|nr:response regulator transcription factor [Terasakiispira papahanaumokuakeensis]ODC05025.1 hypothetical protein BFW38_17280 [Terasakiispira papahanaumokuakeensis]